MKTAMITIRICRLEFPEDGSVGINIIELVKFFN